MPQRKLRKKLDKRLFLAIALVTLLAVTLVGTLWGYRDTASFGNIEDRSFEPVLSSSWSIAVNNPHLDNGGVDWFPQNNPIPVPVCMQETRFCSELGYGFLQQLKVGILGVDPIFAMTWTEAGIGEPYEHPDPANPNMWTGDTDLLPATSHDFYITSAILDWNVALGGYLATGFGGWIILQQPYSIHSDYGVFESRIFEVLIATRGDDIVQAGGNDWSRIWWRSDNSGNAPGWFILQYIISKQQTNEWTTSNLSPTVFSSLISSLENNQPLREKNPVPTVFHFFQNTIKAPNAYADTINLNGAKFRLAFLYLEGANDFCSVGITSAKVIVRSMLYFNIKNPTTW